jgi:hypothetical protein
MLPSGNPWVSPFSDWKWKMSLIQFSVFSSSSLSYRKSRTVQWITSNSKNEVRKIFQECASSLERGWCSSEKLKVNNISGNPPFSNISRHFPPPLSIPCAESCFPTRPCALPNFLPAEGHKLVFAFQQIPMPKLPCFEILRPSPRYAREQTIFANIPIAFAVKEEKIFLGLVLDIRYINNKDWPL